MIFQAEALLFDLDETLVRSSFSIITAWTKFAMRMHLDFDEIKVLLPGRRGTDIINLVCPQLTNQQVQRELETVREDEIRSAVNIEPMSGAAEVLNSLNDWQWAVVTAAPKSLMEARMHGAGLPTPKVSICAEDVFSGKPSSEGFLAAAQQLAVRPDRCIGFEDSALGFEALDAAGIRIIEVGRSTPSRWKSAIASVKDYGRLSIRIMKSYVEIEVWLS